MGLGIKNFNILDVHWKIQLLVGEEGGHEKPIYSGDCLKLGGGGGGLDWI